MESLAPLADGRPPLLDYRPPMAPFCILHADAALIVVDKPAGLLSVPGKAADHGDCLETRLKTCFPGALLVHRLDMDTSGVMVFAASPAAQRHLGLQFERRMARKRYEALVEGEVTGDSGEIDLPLTADWPRRPLQKVCHETGRPAVTRWEVLDRKDGHTRLALHPLTGRSHQLRVHLREIGHPIIGDRFYGDSGVASRLCLHSCALTLRHPDGGAVERFESTCPF